MAQSPKKKSFAVQSQQLLLFHQLSLKITDGKFQLNLRCISRSKVKSVNVIHTEQQMGCWFQPDQRFHWH